MMRRAFLLCLALALPACQVDPSDNTYRSETGPEGVRISANEKILGDWQGLPADSINDGVAQNLLRIEPGKISYVRTCTFSDGTVIEVTATAVAEIRQKNITIAQAAEASASADGHECSVSLDAGVLGYGMVTDSMRLLLDGEFFTLTRAN